jgi:hypothetical protein
MYALNWHRNKSVEYRAEPCKRKLLQQVSKITQCLHVGAFVSTYVHHSGFVFMNQILYDRLSTKYKLPYFSEHLVFKIQKVISDFLNLMLYAKH